VFGPGKWNTICDNIHNWYSLADITEYSKDINIKYLHEAISNIIINLPKVKKKKSHYAYIKPHKSIRSIYARTLRSTAVMDAEKKLITTTNIYQKQHSQNFIENQTRHRNDSTISQINETSNLNIPDQNQSIPCSKNVFNNDIIQLEKLNNKTAFKLQLRSGNEKVLSKCVKNNSEYEGMLRVNTKDYDQENNHLNNLKRKLRSSTNGTKTSPFKNLNYYSS